MVSGLGTFTKRTYTFGRMMGDIARAMKYLILSRNVPRESKLSPRFSEHVMLVVTGVNGCKYCSWVHAKLALEAGCKPDEIKALLDLDHGRIDAREAIALAFAQHYAETGGNPSREASKQLLRTYGRATSIEVLKTISMISIGNLTGNTLDSFDERLKKTSLPPSDGSFLYELIVFIIGKPVTMFMKIGDDRHTWMS